MEVAESWTPDVQVYRAVHFAHGLVHLHSWRVHQPVHLPADDSSHGCCGIRGCVLGLCVWSRIGLVVQVLCRNFINIQGVSELVPAKCVTFGPFRKRRHQCFMSPPRITLKYEITFIFSYIITIVEKTRIISFSESNLFQSYIHFHVKSLFL